MLKQTRASYFSNFKNAQYCALSGDPIPDYIKNGDEVYIIDTAKRCLYDADSGTLIEQPSSGGGGSSDWVNASVTFINNTPENGEYFVDTPFGVIPIEEQETIVLPLKKEDGSIFYLSLKDVIDIESSVAPSVTGDITIEENGFEIQGDGSIAFSSLAPTEISGVPPLELEDALARPLRKLVQHGKVDVSGTDVVCNNGTLKFGATGKNLIAITDGTNTYKGNAGYFTLTYGENSVTFTPTVAGSLLSVWKAFVVKQDMVGQKITFSRTLTGGTCSLIRSDTDDGEMNNSGTLLTNGEGTWTIEQSAVGHAIGIRFSNTTGQVQTLSNVMLNWGETALPYEPYTEGIYADGTPEEIRLNGINQWDEEWEVGRLDYDKNSPTWGQNVDTGQQIRSKNYILISPSTTYYGKAPSGASIFAIYYDADKNPVLDSGGYGYESIANNTFTTPSNARYLRFYQTMTTTYNNDISINYPSTDTDYHPAHIQTATAENLFAVDDIEDTQDIVTGEVIHRTEAIVSDGTTPSGRYVGTVGEGNVIVRVREDKYEGEVVSFETEEELPLNKLVVSLSPQQDLHGYDSPWPAGGGANICDPLLKFTAGTYYGVTLSTTDGYNFTLSGTGTESGNISCPTIPVADCVVYPAGTYTSTGAIFATYKPDGSWYTNRQVGTWVADSDFIVRSAYIQIVEGVTPASGQRFLSLAKGSTALTSWTPFSNICPISGWTGCEVYRTGKNLLDMDNPDGLWGATCTKNEDGSITVVTSSSGGASVQYLLTGKLKPGTYTVTNLSVRNLYVQNNASDYTHAVSTGNSYTFNYDGESYLRLVFANQTSNTTETYKVQLELGSTATDYESYQGNSYSATWEDDVFNADIDVISGEGKNKEIVLTLNTADMNNSEAYPGWKMNLTGIAESGFNDIVRKPTSISNSYGLNTMSIANSIIFFIPSILPLNQPQLKALAIDVQVRVPLATPTDFYATPTPITALKGENNIWSNAGTVSAYVSEGDLVEQVTPQPLITAEGDNTLIVTAEVDDIVFDVAYRKNNSGEETLPDARGVYF